MKSRLAALLLLAGWSALLWYLATTTRDPTPHWVPWRRFFTNFAHAPMFGVQALLIGWGLARRRWPLACLLALAYGTFLEWEQNHIPGRDGSLADVLTDGVGAFGLPWALRSAPRAGLVALLAALSAALATVS